MLRKTQALFVNTFGGLSKEIWFLSFIILVNRSGSMVIPFMTIYLTQSLHFSLQSAGWVLSAYGTGSILGAYLGGKFTDTVGHYWVQFVSLLCAGVIFIAFSFVQTFSGIVFFILLLSILGEAFRPANASSISLYSTPETRTRSFSLNRMAINLGFSIGPALGGILAYYNFQLLFWVDGFTCIAAAFLLLLLIRNKVEGQKEHSPEVKNTAFSSAWKDYKYLIFILLTTLNAICFFQLFSMLPVYMRADLKINEFYIGLVISLNGLIVFLLEMFVVYLIGEKTDKLTMMSLGVLMVGLSFLFLFFFADFWAVVLMVALASLGEIFSMPFMASFAIERSAPSNRGQYMALYTMAYSIGWVVSPVLGARISYLFGFEVLWLGLFVCGAIGFGGFRLLKFKN